jgi:hypothetical protein
MKENGDRETGRRGDGKTGRRGDGEMGRRETGRRGDGRRGDGETSHSHRGFSPVTYADQRSRGTVSTVFLGATSHDVKLRLLFAPQHSLKFFTPAE